MLGSGVCAQGMDDAYLCKHVWWSQEGERQLESLGSNALGSQSTPQFLISSRRQVYSLGLTLRE